MADEDKVLEEITKGMESLKADIEKTIDGKTAEKFVSVAEDIKGIQEKLDAMHDNGEDPGAEKVKDLESKLDEMETNQSEIVESVRLMKAGGVAGMPAEKETLKNFFFKDIGKLRDALDNFSEVKAVDSDLFDTGGKLPAESAKEFWKSVVDQQLTLKAITKRAMMAGTGTTDELTVTARSMVAATEGSAIADNDAIAIRRRTITNVEVAWGTDITKTFLEDNIERGNAEQSIVNQVGLQFGNDIADLGWNGDDDSSTTFLAINDGWITLATADTNVNDVTSYDSGAACSDVLHDWRKGMPTKFRALPDLTYFVPYEFAENYADQVSARLTSLGDAVLINGLPALRYFGHVIIPDPYLASTTGMYTPASNLYLAYNRAVTMETEWKARKRLIELTLTARNDYQYSSGQAIVLGTNIPAALVA